MKRRGFDSAESWGIAGASIIINFLIPTPARLSGVLFVAFMDRYNVNREQASLPFTVCYVLRTLPGPIAGYLGERFGLRKMSLLGCVLCTVGVAACFGAENITTITILLGGCYGLGYGFVSSLSPEFLNQYFEKHLAQANGLTMGGAGLGAFLVPPIVQVLIGVYGVSGMLLIFGGMVLHSVPATMLLRVADFTKETPLDILKAIETPNGPPTIRVSEDSTAISKKVLDASLKRTREVCPLYTVTEDHPPNMSSSYTIHQKGHPTNRSSPCTIHQEGHPPNTSSPYTIHQECPPPNTSSPYTIHQEGHPHKSHQNGAPLLLTIRNLRHSLTPGDTPKFSFKAPRGHLLEAKRAASESFRVFLDPAFLLITLTQSSYFFITFLMWTIIVDFARDKGISQSKEVYFAMCLSLADTLGRLGLGFITDRGFMSKPNYSALCFLGLGVLSMVLPWTSGFYMTMVVVFTYGFISGGIIIIFPGMVAQFINKDLRTMAMASRTLLNAPMSLMISPLIGYFRENLGSYDYIFGIVTMVSVLCGITSWSTPKVAILRDLKKEKIKHELDRSMRNTYL